MREPFSEYSGTLLSGYPAPLPSISWRAPLPSVLTVQTSTRPESVEEKAILPPSGAQLGCTASWKDWPRRLVAGRDAAASRCGLDPSASAIQISALWVCGFV